MAKEKDFLLLILCKPDSKTLKNFLSTEMEKIEFQWSIFKISSPTLKK